jgi:hypothetical protein
MTGEKTLACKGCRVSSNEEKKMAWILHKIFVKVKFRNFTIKFMEYSGERMGCKWH